ncbi:hypothetical protein [Aminipila terrae]|uniref:Uncharacterized protein n=1 Tax=Aminipila terrae TaxID=2697030 RepID=A0A6P1MRH3_9FIRM|nr:hypothetical protein [Aminipila terrae]QHI73595.1 hypothetical protein Ami3637_15530 [Aminipila terrae]
MINLILGIFITLCLTGCTPGTETNNVVYEELINEGIPGNVRVILFYNQYKSAMGIQHSAAYELNNDGISEINQRYIMGGYNIFPEQELTLLSENVGYKNSDDLIRHFGQPFLYKSYESGEIFLLEGATAGKDIFTVFLKVDDKYNMIKIQHTVGDTAIGIYHDKNNMYVLSSSGDQSQIVLYEIDTTDFSLTKYVIPAAGFGLDRVALYTDSNLIYNNMLYVIPKSSDGHTSNILMYDLKTNVCKKVINKEGVSSNIFNEGDKLMVLNIGKRKISNHSDSLYIDYYDYELNYLSSEGIPIDIVNPTEFKTRNFCYFYDNRIMGSINIKNREKMNCIFIYDISKKQVLYLSRLTHERMILNDDLFMYKKDNDYYHIF